MRPQNPPENQPKCSPCHFRPPTCGSKVTKASVSRSRFNSNAFQRQRNKASASSASLAACRSCASVPMVFCLLKPNFLLSSKMAVLSKWQAGNRAPGLSLGLRAVTMYSIPHIRLVILDAILLEEHPKRGQFLIMSYCAILRALLTAAIQQMFEISRREPI